jgi:MbtH-like protein
VGKVPVMNSTMAVVTLRGSWSSALMAAGESSTDHGRVSSVAVGRRGGFGGDARVNTLIGDAGVSDGAVKVLAYLAFVDDPPDGFPMWAAVVGLPRIGIGNNEDQHSMQLDFAAAPAGWNIVHAPGFEAACYLR